MKKKLKLNRETLHNLTFSDSHHHAHVVAASAICLPAPDGDGKTDPIRPAPNQTQDYSCIVSCYAICMTLGTF